MKNQNAKMQARACKPRLVLCMNASMLGAMVIVLCLEVWRNIHGESQFSPIGYVGGMFIIGMMVKTHFNILEENSVECVTELPITRD